VKSANSKKNIPLKTSLSSPSLKASGFYAQLDKFMDGHGDNIYTGFLAQEVEQALVKTGNKSFSGLIKPQNETEHYSLRYAEFTVPLVKAVQEQQATIDALEKKVEAQQKTNELLLERLEKLEQIVANKPLNQNRAICMFMR
jgi:hypothetical protein